MTGIGAGIAFLLGLALGWRIVILIALFVIAIGIAQRRRDAVLPLAIVLLAAAAGGLRGTPPLAPQAIDWPAEAADLHGIVITPPSVTGRSQGFVLQVETGAQSRTGTSASAMACITAAPFPLLGLGDSVTVTGRPVSPYDSAIATRAFMRHRGCAVTMYAESFAVSRPGDGWRRLLVSGRVRLSQALQHAAPGDSGALLSGLVTGDDSALSRQRQQAFLRTGTTHITAVSGSNVALIVGILAVAGGGLGWRRHLPWQALVVALIWAYALAVGGEPPVIRAAAVATAALLAIRFGRRADPVTLIFVAAVVMTAINPSQIWSLSFQLSFAASLGIVLALAGIPATGPFAGLQAALKATLAAQIATLPILWIVLGQISLTTLITNLLIAPLVALAFPLAAAAGMAALVWAPFGVVVALPARFLAEAVFAIVDRLGGSPAALLTVGETSPALALVIIAIAGAALAPLSHDAARRWARLADHGRHSRT